VYAAFLTTGASYRNSNMLISSLLYAILPARRLGGERYPLSPPSERSAAGSYGIYDMGPNRPRPTASSYLYKAPQGSNLASEEQKKFQLQCFETGRHTVKGLETATPPQSPKISALGDTLKVKNK
jgi:hypothetical protein